MNNVSILGCGWLGKPLAISFLEDGFSVKGSTTSEDKIAILEALEIDTHLVNISEFEEYDLFLESDILIIAITSKDTDGFENLIAQIQESSIQKVIFISSTSVYPRSNKVMTEDAEVINNHPLVDCINIIHEIINQNCWNETFNACANHHPSRREFYINARESKGFELPIFKHEAVYEWKIISSDKVQRVLEYTFIHDNLLRI